MGEMVIRFRICGQEFEAIVDTAATFTKLPKLVAYELGLDPKYETEIELEDGRRIIRKLALAEITIEDVTRPALVSIGDEEDKPVLGRTTLELLGFKENPATGKLERTLPREYQHGAEQSRKTELVQPVTTIIVPAYNEQDGLPVVLRKILSVIDESYEVVVVDDGSTDRTSEVACQFQCRLIRHETNRGKGEAIKTGVRNAKGRNVICIDADDTYPVETIPRIAEALTSYDLVVGSRRYGRENIPAFNRLGNFVFCFLIRKAYGFKPQDPLTGLWGIRKCCAEKILPEARWVPDAEMQMKAARMRLRMFDIPIAYAPRIGQTKLHALKGGYEHLRLILSLLFWKPKQGSKR